MTPTQEGKLMSAFLREIAAGVGCEVVKLGALKGFPAVTKDPAMVQKAIDHLIERADELPIGVKQLKMRQRIIDLRYGKECLEESGDDTEAHVWFVERGAAWCEANGVEYAALRDCGVPPALLKKAGVPQV